MSARNVLPVSEGGKAIAEEGREGVPHMRVVDDPSEFEATPGRSAHVYRARWQLFLPTIAIAVLYLAAWSWLVYTGRGEGALARMFVLVMAIGVPLLAFHAFLRYQTIKVHVLENAVRYHPGWPKDLPVDMPPELIEEVRVRRGISGRLFGGGTLVMLLTTGQKAAIADLADPDNAKAEIEAMLA